MPSEVYVIIEEHKKNVSKFLKGHIPWNKDKKFPKEEYPNYGMRGKTAWNKNLTKETDERVVKNAKNISKSKKKWWVERGKEEKMKILRPFLEAGQKTMKEKVAKMSKREKRNYFRPLYEAGQKAVRKRWAEMTKEERLESLKPYIQAGQKASKTLEARQKGAKSRKRWWARMTEKEKLEYLKSFLEAGQKAMKKKFARMTGEERKEYMKPWLESVQRRWKQMTKEEKLKRMLPAIIASSHANPSSIEKMIWKALDEFGINYETHVSFNNGKFIVDIYVPTQRLIIECNGDYWHDYKIFPEREKRDKKLGEYANKNNYRIAWLWEAEIKKNPKSALIKGLKGGVENLCGLG